VVNVAFRVDASSQIGTGHFMRCLTLARALRQRGMNIRFVSRPIPEHLRNLLNTERHEFVSLNCTSAEAPADGLYHSHWLGTSQQSDAQDTILKLSDRDWDWLIVDHYSLDYRWETQLRNVARRILVIDDLADRKHDCDVLLDQNSYMDMDVRYIAKVPASCQLLLGSRYVLLREEFRKIRNHVRTRSGTAERLLVVFGGVDVVNYTGYVIEALVNLELTNLHVDVVIGAQHPFRQQIVADCLKHGFSCHVQTDHMAELMARADVAIGACGFTSYEFAAMQLPAILIPVSEIQTTVVKELAKKGIAYALLPAEQHIIGDICAALKEVLGSGSLRSSMSLACRDFVDTEGTERVVEKLEYGESS
jgi:UDP-2,4-diacetamido-2,4,6-trideoxy-beta-L-altropyranose hydrolase